MNDLATEDINSHATAAGNILDSSRGKFEEKLLKVFPPLAPLYSLSCPKTKILLTYNVDI